MSDKMIGDKIGRPYFFEDRRSIVGLITPNHNVGVEVEIENVVYEFTSENPIQPRMGYFSTDSSVNSLSKMEHWQIVKDNSLRNGVEFIFNGPKKGKNILLAMEELETFFKEYRRKGSPPVASDRCSIHIHLDIRDLDESKLNNLLMWYILFERVLFEYVHPSRLKNNYCRPINDSSFKHILSNIKEKGSDFLSVLHLIRGNCDKYSALNLLPIQNFGSVEFRHHQGTSSSQEIIDWINIILSLKLMASFDPSDNLGFLDHWQGSGENYKELIKKVFEGTVLTSQEFLNRDILKPLIKKGISDLKEILFFDELRKANTHTPKVKLKFNLLHEFRRQNSIERKKEPLNKSKLKYKPVFPPPLPTINPSLSSAFLNDSAAYSAQIQAFNTMIDGIDLASLYPTNEEESN